MRDSRMVGPLLVGLAAILWATDALFRFPAVHEIHPALLVLCEHLVALAVLAPWIIWKHGRALFALKPFEWAASLMIGVGASALGTIFFTASFRFVNPSVTILLQKLQPILAVALAWMVLGERPRPGFFIWAAVALVAASVLSFPDFGFLEEGVELRSRGVLYALIAAVIWAISTVAGKSLLNRQPPGIVVFWRYVFGTLGLLALSLISGAHTDRGPLSDPSVVKAIIYMGLIPGLAAMVLYYNGMKRTQASVTAFMELIFPIGAVLLNTWILDLPLTPLQILAGLALLLAVTQISRGGFNVRNSARS